MILPYTLRLVFLCFACFFLVQAVFGLASWAGTTGAIRAAETMGPRSAARFLLLLRLLPGTLAAFAVAVLCIPSYLLLETNAPGERVGLLCSAAALLGAAISIRSLARVARVLWISARHNSVCLREGQNMEEAGRSSILVMNGERPVMALTGVIRQRIVVSRALLQALSGEELDAALDHERAHHKSRDNLKRLMMAMAPEIFPFSRLFARLERSWARFTEYAADDEAAAGDSRRSVSLASALVNVARMGGPGAVPELASSLLEDNDELAWRVERLLSPAPAREETRSRAFFTIAAVAIAVAAITLALQPLTLNLAHTLLEHLVR